MTTITIPEFSNEPLSDFSDPHACINEKISNALKMVRKGILGTKVPIIMNGTEMFTDEYFERENPSRLGEVITRICFARIQDINQAVGMIKKSSASRKWAEASFKERADCLKTVAQKFREKRFFFIALMMLEVGKSAPEADAEFCEAVDFLEWYAAYAPFVEELGNKTLLNPLGEVNSSMYIPISNTPICASIQPWNFPLAISVGPAAAALVCGYSVIYKPAEQSSLIGYHIVKTFLEGSIPSEVFYFLPGTGEEVGKYLVRHHGVNAVAFTGSKQVRQSIQNAITRFNTEEITQLPHKDRYEKRALALESGGKNAIIVDSDADLDEVIIGVSDSAFGYQGQKCSACSRLIIVDEEGKQGSVYSTIIERLKERIESLTIGSPEDPKNKIGPLVDREAFEKFYRYIELAKKEGVQIYYRGVMPESSMDGHFVSPILLEVVSPESRLAHEEIFAPVLAVFHVPNFLLAIELANRCEFALTAGVYSRNPCNIELAKKRLNAGNIYINRGITGAIVGRQPFSGFKMSGNGTKAGGWDYLLSFLLDQKIITENTMRRGIPME